MKQTIIPHMKLISSVIQVGAPKYPTGIAVHGGFKIEGTEWTRRKWYQGRGWNSKPVIIFKDFTLEFGDKDVEKFLNEWKAGVIDYEAWRAEMDEQHQRFVKQLDAKEHTRHFNEHCLEHDKHDCDTCWQLGIREYQGDEEKAATLAAIKRVAMNEAIKSLKVRK